MFFDDGENTIDIVPGIDHHGFAGLFIAHDRAVALQRTNSKYFVNHSRDPDPLGILASIRKAPPQGAFYFLVLCAHNYFGVGVVGFGGGALVGSFCCCCVGVLLMPCNTEFDEERREAKIERVIEVIMKITAAQVVAFVKTVAAPRGPNAVWLPIPPKAAAMSALLPLCSNTTMMRNRQTMI